MVEDKEYSDNYSCYQQYMQSLDGTDAKKPDTKDTSDKNAETTKLEKELDEFNTKDDVKDDTNSEASSVSSELTAGDILGEYSSSVDVTQPLSVGDTKSDVKSEADDPKVADVEKVAKDDASSSSSSSCSSSSSSTASSKAPSGGKKLADDYIDALGMSFSKDLKLKGKEEPKGTDRSASWNNNNDDDDIDESSNQSDDQDAEDDGDADDEDRYSFLPNDDRSSCLNRTSSEKSSGSLSTGRVASTDAATDDTKEGEKSINDDFRQKFLRMNTRDTLQHPVEIMTGTMDSDLRNKRGPKLETTLESNEESEPGDIPEPEKKLEDDDVNDTTDIDKEEDSSADVSKPSDYSEDVTTDSKDIGSGNTSRSPDNNTSSMADTTISTTERDYSDWKIPVLPKINQQEIFALPTAEERINALKQKRQELLNFDTGLSTYLKEIVKKGTQPLMNNKSIGTHVRDAYEHSQKPHHHYSTSTVGSVTTELASDLIRRSSVLKQKSKNFFRRIHLKTTN